ncbi:hypothetical protein [Macrococcoides caseolyticum]|uniref:hypothetical protein n=1 Tax=Macrococcoides caseolyticum TaxID=69966 RepID=UPI000C34BF8F|nr:hypothetical protein [Macrococcus caseolyticus]PKE18571.1 hypothetical protein CW679_10425 [Macrococcus caseolyticus]PKF39975.1 hypothetical protein CW661_10725 [Macrococcus caseolyticus]QYA35702.1 hypothetical protein KYI08_02115 [Macrococcus caseolyticus]
MREIKVRLTTDFKKYRSELLGCSDSFNVGKERGSKSKDFFVSVNGKGTLDVLEESLEIIH